MGCDRCDRCLQDACSLSPCISLFQLAPLPFLLITPLLSLCLSCLWMLRFPRLSMLAHLLCLQFCCILIQLIIPKKSAFLSLICPNRDYRGEMEAAQIVGSSRVVRWWRGKRKVFEGFKITRLCCSVNGRSRSSLKPHLFPHIRRTVKNFTVQY